MPEPTFRFAPSPNGALHLGHARSALLCLDMARAVGGRFLIRIEDIDPARCRPDFETAIRRDLDRLGVRSDRPIRRQSDHLDDYAAALESLRRQGLVYPSFLSRSDRQQRVAAAEAAGRIWPRDPDGAPLYPGDDRDLDPAIAQARIAAGVPHAWRLRIDRALAVAGSCLTWQESGGVDQTIADDRAALAELTAGRPLPLRQIAADPAAWGDVVVSRKDAPSSYHLSVVVDDALQGVTHVVRGADLFHATSVHRLLQSLLGLPQPVYHHHALVNDADGRKLAKSDGDGDLADYLDRGLDPADIRRLVGL